MLQVCCMPDCNNWDYKKYFGKFLARHGLCSAHCKDNILVYVNAHILKSISSHQLTYSQMHVRWTKETKTERKVYLWLIADDVDAARIYKSDDTIWVVTWQELCWHWQTIHIHRHWRTGHLKDIKITWLEWTLSSYSGHMPLNLAKNSEINL